ILSAVAYMYAPYHIQDLYIRGAFAEFSAFAFFPLLLFSFLKMSRTPSWRYFLLGVLSTFGLSLTHNVMTMLFFPIAGLYIVFLSFLRKTLSGFFLSILALVIGLMMSSFFWLPAFQEKQFLNMIFLVFLHYEFHHGFLSWSQLFNTPWGVDLVTTKKVPYHV